MTILPNEISYEDSYVLAIAIEPYSIRVKMDFVLTSRHPLYRTPEEGERDCFLQGEIRIDGFLRIEWLATGAKPSFDSSGQADFGTLDHISVVSGEAKLSGDWGTIEVTGGEFTLSFL